MVDDKSTDSSDKDVKPSRAHIPHAHQLARRDGKREWKPHHRTLCLLMTCASVWVTCAILDAIYTPRVTSYKPSKGLIVSYQWCMVGYLSNLILTLLKVVFERNQAKMTLHMVSCYINILAASSYFLLWTGFSPILPDVNSCLYIPQRWILYCFTAPAIIFILCQISDYNTRMRVWVIGLNVFMLAAGGLGTIPWITWEHKVFWYVMSCVPFPSIVLHMFLMVSSALDETAEPGSKRGVQFIRIFSITTWNLFPFLYFAAIDGILPLEISEPAWAALDWLTKMVYSSSLMEANFFTIAQRREFAVKAVEEANRLQTIQQLSLAIERKDDFLSTMSHELRTPLNGIIGLSEGMLAGACGDLPEKAFKTISTVKLSGKRLLQLINDILDAAKMKQGTLVIKHEQVDLCKLAGDVVDLSSPLVRKGVKLVSNVGNVPKIIGDNGRIVQILYNLVGNACKFTRTGSISITAGLSEDRSVVYVSVTDTGCGIPKDKLTKIFGAFEQADMSTTRRYGGTGLGLHLVQELVKAHNGDITVDSDMGVGSTFTIWLPITQVGATLVVDDEKPDGKLLEELEEEESMQAIGRLGVDRDLKLTSRESSTNRWMGEHRSNSISLRAPRNEVNADDGALLSVTRQGVKATKPFYRERHGGCLVLSVDDDPINQMVVENLLVPEGYKVEQAMGGSEALEFLANSATLPDVILLDVMMPDMSGYEVCEEIRRRFSSVSIPIIMVSAKANPEHVMKGLEAGSVDYVKKPFHRQELLSRVRAQIRNREVFEAEVESRKVTDMMKRIMPMSVINRLQQGQSMIADSHESVTVLFADAESFWKRDGFKTSETVMLMNEVYSMFEKLLLKHQVFRVEHCGDNYMVVSGHDGTPDHTPRMLELAKDMAKAVEGVTHGNREQAKLRISLHRGPAFAGVVGIDNPRYCVFGDTITAADHLQRIGYPATIHVSETVVEHAPSKDMFVPYRTGVVVGTATMSTYLMKLGPVDEALKHVENEKVISACGDESLKKQNAELEQELEMFKQEADAARSEAARAQVVIGTLQTQLQLEGEEKKKLQASVTRYEALLEEARQSVRAAAATTTPSVAGSLPPAPAGYPPINEVGRSTPSVGAGVGMGVGFMPQPSYGYMQQMYASTVAPSEVMSVAAPSVTASVAKEFWDANYPLDMFLADIGLTPYLQMLLDQDVTPMALATMTDADLKEIGIEKIGARRRMLEAARHYAGKMQAMTRPMMAAHDAALLGGGRPWP